jgi:hypothetical protein
MNLSQAGAYIWRGKEKYRVSRFHTLNGEFVGIESLYRDLPRALLGSFMRNSLRYYPITPWAPLPLIRELSMIANNHQRILEVGAGMSTIWWAEKGSTVHAIEGNRQWHNMLQRRVLERGLQDRVTLEFREGEDYFNLSTLPDASFSFVTVDGHARNKVIPQIPRLLSYPGWVLLGDTDKAAVWHEHWGESLEALRVLVREHRRATLKHYSGFGPTSIAPGQDTLAFFPGKQV